MKNTFFVSCPIDTYSGYGARSRDFVKALIELDKYDVKVLPQRWGATPFHFIDNNPEWEFLRSYVLWDVPPGQIPQKPDIWCQITVPNEFQPVGHYNIGVTAGIETTICHGSWIEGCNRMDLILGSSNHSVNVFEDVRFDQIDNKTKQKIGVMQLTKPMKVLLEGADLDTYKPLKTKEEFKGIELYNDINKIPESFAYLVVGHWMQGDMGEDRKNIGLTIKSFYECFKNKKKRPALIIKTCQVGSSYTDRREIMRRIDSIRKGCTSKDLPTIYLLHGEFSNTEMNELYNHPKIKAMISLTKGEGFGRPLLEFSLVNKPIISSGWSGQIDFLSPKFSALLPGQLTNVHQSAAIPNMILPESQWFSVDLRSVETFMVNIFEQYKHWKNNANRQGYKSRSEFSFDKMKENLDKLLEENVKHIPSAMNLNLPKLKKSNSGLSLPKLKKV